jgi:Mce-associated membrane protein
MKIVVLLAAVFAAWGGWSWWSAGHDDARLFALDRQAVTQAAQHDIATLNTLDYRKIDDGLKSWLAVSTGTLHDQLAQTGTDNRKQLEQAKTVTTAQVVDTAVTALDQRAGTARLIAAVQLDVTPDAGQKTSKRARFQADLTRTGQGWQVSAIAPVQVQS